MTKKNLFAAGYKAPEMEIAPKCLCEMLCTSSEGLTEDIGDIEDLTW